MNLLSFVLCSAVKTIRDVGTEVQFHANQNESHSSEPTVAEWLTIHKDEVRGSSWKQIARYFTLNIVLS